MRLKTTTNINQIIRPLNKRIPDSMAKAKFPALSLALIRDAQLVWAEGFGVTNTSSPAPVTKETLFEAIGGDYPSLWWLRSLFN